MSLLQVLIMAVIQGITEFLPISSDGHLVAVATLMGKNTAEFDVSDVIIVLHGGTLASILVFYWQRIWRLIGSDRRTIWLLVVGTLPAVVLGLGIKVFFEEWLENPWLAGIMLWGTAIVLLIGANLNESPGEYQQLSMWSSFLIGVAQALAILPGLSRSGSTIVAGIGQGLSRRSAATFSFLLAIPAITGACVLEGKELLEKTTGGTRFDYLAIGAVVSFVVGLASLWWLTRWLERGRLQPFAYWCMLVGTFLLIWKYFH